MPDPIHPTTHNIVKISCSQVEKEQDGGTHIRRFAKTRKRKN